MSALHDLYLALPVSTRLVLLGLFFLLLGLIAIRLSRILLHSEGKRLVTLLAILALGFTVALKLEDPKTTQDLKETEHAFSSLTAQDLLDRTPFLRALLTELLKRRPSAAEREQIEQIGAYEKLALTEIGKLRSLQTTDEQAEALLELFTDKPETRERFLGELINIFKKKLSDNSSQTAINRLKIRTLADQYENYITLAHETDVMDYILAKVAILNALENRPGICKRVALTEDRAVLERNVYWNQLKTFNAARAKITTRALITPESREDNRSEQAPLHYWQLLLSQPVYQEHGGPTGLLPGTTGYFMKDDLKLDKRSDAEACAEARKFYTALTQSFAIPGGEIYKKFHARRAKAASKVNSRHIILPGETEIRETLAQQIAFLVSDEQAALQKLFGHNSEARYFYESEMRKNTYTAGEKHSAADMEKALLKTYRINYLSYIPFSSPKLVRQFLKDKRRVLRRLDHAPKTCKAFTREQYGPDFDHALPDRQRQDFNTLKLAIVLDAIKNPRTAAAELTQPALWRKLNKLYLSNGEKAPKAIRNNTNSLWTRLGLYTLSPEDSCSKTRELYDMILTLEATDSANFYKHFVATRFQ